MVDTRQRILDTARELFNEAGVARVGVREIARALEMSPGNLAYHFATKDELVAALVKELHARVNADVGAGMAVEPSLIGLYRAAQAAMRDLLAYRFVLLSYVDAVRASPELQALAAEHLVRRRQRHDLLLEALARAGYLDRRAALARSDLLFEQGELISSGWLNAATVRGWQDDEETIRHFAKVGVALLEPYCTPRGAREMRRILSGDLDLDLDRSRDRQPARRRKSP
jgi:AcrR family transcriptional regulator